MLSLIKQSKKKAAKDGSRSGSIKLLGKRSKSLTSRPSAASAAATKAPEVLPKQQKQQEPQAEQEEPQLVTVNSGGTVLLQSGGGLSFGFTAMEIPNNSHGGGSRPSSRSSNSSRR
jgi:hypothetical protein